MIIRSQMKTHFFDPKKQISIKGFLATFKLACGTSHTHKRANMWAFLHHIEETLANTLNSCLYGQDPLALLAVSFCGDQPWFHKFLRLFPEVLDHFLTKYSTRQAIAKYDVTIFHYVQPANMTSQQFSDDLIAKSCKVAGVYDESTLNHVFI